MAVIPSGCAQANYKFTGAAVPNGAQITMGYAIDTYSGDPSDMADDLILAWVGTIELLHTSACVLTSVLVKFGPNDTGGAAEVSCNVTGNATGDSDSPNVATLVRKNTGFGGRTGRGRFFLPGAPSTYLNQDGTFGSTWPVTLQARLDDWYTAQLAAGLVPVLLHSEDSPVTTPMPIVGFSADIRVATQRRRLRR